MPKRSNAFQQLIYAIQHSISDGSKVSESEFLIDKQTGAEVEVDIVIETTVNDFPVIISIEVRDRKRPATVEWIRESIGKHATLPTNKLVLVSSSGFTKEAKQKAEQNSIDALTLDEAEELEWSKTVSTLCKDDMKIAVFNLSWKNYSVDYITLIKDGKEVVIQEGALNECNFTNGDKNETAKMINVPGSILNNAKVARPIMQQWIKEGKEDFCVTWNVPEGSFLTDKPGNIFKVNHVKVIGHCQVKSLPIDFKYNTFQNAHVAHATVEDIVSKEPTSGEVTLTIIERAGTQRVSSVTLPKPDELGRRVLIMRIPKKPRIVNNQSVLE